MSSPAKPAPTRAPRKVPARGRTRLTAAERSRRARVAAIRRHHPDDPERVRTAQEALREAAAERHIRDLVAKWPPLSAAQRNRLAALRGRGGGRRWLAEQAEGAPPASKGASKEQHRDRTAWWRRRPPRAAAWCVVKGPAAGMR